MNIYYNFVVYYAKYFPQQTIHLPAKYEEPKSIINTVPKKVIITPAKLLIFSIILGVTTTIFYKYSPYRN